MKGLNIAEWSIRHKQIIWFFIVSIIIGGIWSYFNLGRSEDPNFTIRQMVVTAAWPGASAREITEQVTDPLEKKLQDTPGLDYLKSFTHDGKTVIYVNLKDTVSKGDIRARWQEVRNLVNDEWGSLPSGVVGPVINDRFDDVSDPFMRLPAMITAMRKSANMQKTSAVSFCRFRMCRKLN